MMSREKMIEECSRLTGVLTHLYPAQVDKVFFENLSHEELIREFISLNNDYDEMLELK